VTSSPTAETARRDLDRIFNTEGVAALVGNTYGAAKDVGVYVSGEAIRGLADLEAKDRERCANFATKAVAAGSLNVPYESQSDRPGDGGWCKQRCEKLIFHRSRHRHSRPRWHGRLGSLRRRPDAPPPLDALGGRRSLFVPAEWADN
jgi:hypothetical protein